MISSSSSGFISNNYDSAQSNQVKESDTTDASPLSSNCDASASDVVIIDSEHVVVAESKSEIDNFVLKWGLTSKFPFLVFLMGLLATAKRGLK